jgi:hypothetical protein
MAMGLRWAMAKLGGRGAGVKLGCGVGFDLGRGLAGDFAAFHLTSAPAPL